MKLKLQTFKTTVKVKSGTEKLSNNRKSKYVNVLNSGRTEHVFVRLMFKSSSAIISGVLPLLSLLTPILKMILGKYLLLAILEASMFPQEKISLR